MAQIGVVQEEMVGVKGMRAKYARAEGGRARKTMAWSAMR
jgi:hypothetical protein